MQFRGRLHIVDDDGLPQQMLHDRSIDRFASHEIGGEANPLRMLVPVVTILQRRKCVGAEDVDAAAEFFERGLRGDGGRMIVGDERLVLTVERGFDHVGVFDVDAKHVGDQAADEWKLLFALPQDRFDAFADAFTAGFEILEQFLTTQQA